MVLASKHRSSLTRRTTVFWGVVRFRLVGIYQGYGGPCCLFLHSD
jgi:hypothetical protein